MSTPDVYCALQVERHASRFAHLLMAKKQDLKNLLRRRDENEIKENRSWIQDVLGKVEQLRQTIDAAQFGTSFSEECYESLGIVTRELASCLELIVGLKGQHDKAQVILDNCSKLLNGLQAKSQSILSAKPPTPPSLAHISSQQGDGIRFRVLHVTDLHAGQQQAKYDWNAVKKHLLDDLQLLESNNPEWDVLLFTGDAAYSGQPDEFDQVTELFHELWETRGWQNTKLLTVPGNHDLRYFKQRDAKLKGLLNYHDDDDVVKGLWGPNECEYRDPIAEAFANYEGWLPKIQHLRPETYSEGKLPGDYAATIEKDGAKLGVLGLNSSFLQIAKPSIKNEFYGKLAICGEQARLACAGVSNTLEDWAAGHDVRLLATHHPLNWLEPDCRKEFENLTFTAKNFDAHMCGHCHVPSADFVATMASATARRTLLGRSLHGLEKSTSGIDRIFGYAAIEFFVPRDKGVGKSFQIWPRVAKLSQGGRLIPDYEHYELDIANGTHATSPFQIMGS